jgi:hypothetical protein
MALYDGLSDINGYKCGIREGMKAASAMLGVTEDEIRLAVGEVTPDEMRMRLREQKNNKLRSTKKRQKQKLWMFSKRKH